MESARITLDAGSWRKLRVTMHGDHIECYLDGTLYLDVHDGIFTEAGKIGLWTKADAYTLFDDLNSRSLPPL